MKNKTNHLKISKPIFWKKIRVYNDLSKKEKFSLTFYNQTHSNVIVKTSYLEKILDGVGKISHFHMTGGKLYFSDVEKNKKQYIFDIKIYDASPIREKQYFNISLHNKVCLFSAYSVRCLIIFFIRLNFLKINFKK